MVHRCGRDQGVVRTAVLFFETAASMRAWVRATATENSSTGMFASRYSTNAPRCARRCAVLARSTPTRSSLARRRAHVGAAMPHPAAQVDRAAGFFGQHPDIGIDQETHGSVWPCALPDCVRTRRTSFAMLDLSAAANRGA